MAICPRCKKPMDSNTESGYCSTCEAALRFSGELPKAVQNKKQDPTLSIVRDASKTQLKDSSNTDENKHAVITARCIMDIHNGQAIVIDRMIGPTIGNLVAYTLKKLTKSIEENNNNVYNICYGPVIENALWIEESVSIIYEGSKLLKPYVVVNGTINRNVLQTEWKWEE